MFHPEEKSERCETIDDLRNLANARSPTDRHWLTVFDPVSAATEAHLTHE